MIYENVNNNFLENYLDKDKFINIINDNISSCGIDRDILMMSYLYGGELRGYIWMNNSINRFDKRVKKIVKTRKNRDLI